MIPIGMGWAAAAQAAVSAKQQGPQYPFVACLQGKPNESMCGEVLLSSDFRFQDAKWAVEHYADGKSCLKVCPKCVVAFKTLEGK